MASRLFAIIALLALAACDRGMEGSGASAPALQEERTLTASVSGSSALTISLLPREPTVLDTLQAAVQGGSGRPVFSWDINGEPLEGRRSDRLPAGTAAKGDTVRVQAQFAEGGETATAEVVITNAPPRITSVSFAVAAIHRGVDIEVTPHADDPDGDPVRFEYGWFLNGEALAFADGPVLSGDRFRRGDRILVQVIPFDAESQGPMFPAAELEIPNAPPSFATEPATAFQKEGYRYRASAVDPDDDRLTYYLKSGPTGMEIDAPSGELFWRIEDVEAGEHQVRLGVHDPEGMSAQQEFTLNVSFP